MRILLAALVVLAGATATLAQPYNTPSYGNRAMRLWYGQGIYATDSTHQMASPYALPDETYVSDRKQTSRAHHKHRRRTPR